MSLDGIRAFDQQPLDHFGRDMLAEQVGDAIARGGGRDAGLELMPQLNADRARQDSGDQEHHAADQLEAKIRRRLGGETRRMIQHRHREQLAPLRQSR